MKKNVHIDALVPYIGSIVLILCGSLFFPQILSADYLLQQLQIAAFLGLLATGATIIILLGHIDLSVPWVLSGAAILSTALAGSASSAHIFASSRLICTRGYATSLSRD